VRKAEPKVEPELEPKSEPKQKVVRTSKVAIKGENNIETKVKKTPKKVDTDKLKVGKKKSPAPRRMSKQSKISEELAELMESLKKSDDVRKKINMDEVRQLNKDFGKAVSKAKREAEEQELRHAATKPSKSTRSGLKRGAFRAKEEYSEGKYINIGMEAVSDKFDKDELEYLETEVRKVKNVKDLKFEHLKYLISYMFYDELAGIKKGEIQSDFHDRYMELVGNCKKELQSEIRTTLFTNEQRDYISGYLQELFEATKTDSTGAIKHGEIEYVETVTLHELTVRIVKFVYGLASAEETLAFMKSKSREAYGISDDEDDL